MQPFFYYPRTFENITTALLDLFNDIQVKRYESDQLTVRKTINVPLTFGPVDKNEFIRKENYSQEEGSKYYLQLPRLALSFDGMNYNSDRVTGINEVRYFYSDALKLNDIDDFYADPQPAPWDYNFTLHIMTESLTDFSQIIEQILPYFSASCIYLRVKEFSFLNIERDLKVVLNSVQPEFLLKQEEATKRYVNGTISLTVQGFMYYPYSSTGIVKILHSEYFIDMSDKIGGTSATEVSDYSTSGYEATSAGSPELSAVSAISTSSYDYSGYDVGPPKIYYFTSADNYNI